MFIPFQMHFIGYWNGNAVNYDEGKATLNLRARKEHESNCRPASHSCPDKRGDDSVGEEDQAEKDRSRDEWNAQRDADREEAKRLREEEKDLKNWCSVRRESSHYPKLEEDKDAIDWRRKWEAICKAQQVDFMLDGNYDPDTDTERLGMPYKFKIAQALIYAALLESVRTLMGKAIIIKHKDDGLKAYAEIINYYFGASSHATVAANALRKEIKASDQPMRILCRGWRSLLRIICAPDGIDCQPQRERLRLR